MKTLSLLIVPVILCNMLYGQNKADCKVDCVKLSTIAYLITVRNNTNHVLFLPVKPWVQKANDTLFVSALFSYLHNGSTVYAYKIDGVRFETITPLNDYIKPDSVYKETTGPMPNFAVPSRLFELKPQSTFFYKIFSSDIQNPRVIAFSVFSKNGAEEKFMQIALGDIIPARVEKTGKTK